MDTTQPHAEHAEHICCNRLLSYEGMNFLWSLASGSNEHSENNRTWGRAHVQQCSEDKQSAKEYTVSNKNVHEGCDRRKACGGKKS